MAECTVQFYITIPINACNNIPSLNPKPDCTSVCFPSQRHPSSSVSGTAVASIASWQQHTIRREHSCVGHP